MPNPNPLTPEIIAAHERLHPRLAALLKQVERVAGRRPGQVVPEGSVRLARELCREAVTLLGRKAGRGIGLPQADARSGPLDHAGLATVLGQALAALESFESEHSGFSTAAKCTVWQLDGPSRPVTRLLPPGHAGNAIATHDPEMERIREGIERRIMARYAAGYDTGYRHAQEGKPPNADYGELIWDSIVEKRGGDEAARLAGFKRRIRYTTPPRHLVPEGAVLSDPRTRKSTRERVWGPPPLK